MRPLRPRAILIPAVLLAVLPGVAFAASAQPLSPPNGSSVKITPPAGFANGDVKLKWSIEYSDCPGPDSIHGSSPEVRVAGGTWNPAPGGGPFLGAGTHTATHTLFPETTAVKVEWRIFWACGATEGFAGLQGRSSIASFTMQPASSATSPVPPCSGLAGKTRTRCVAKQKRDTELKRCAKLKTKPQRDTCSKRARDAYTKAIKNA